MPEHNNILSNIERRAAALDELAEAGLKVVPLKRKKKSGTAQTVNGIRTTDEEGRPRKQADVLLDIGRTHDLFHGDAGTAYALVGKAVYAVESSAYREILAGAFLDATNKGANRNALTDAVTTLSALAKHKSETRKVWLRVGKLNGNIIIDTGRADRWMIEVSPNGWQWCESPPMFRRTSGMKELPEPKTADFSLIWKYVNVAVEHRPLVAAWLLASFMPDDMKYPILLLSGEQGTGKSTATRIIRRVVDPSSSELRSPPKDTRDLLVGALNGWVLALDNLSFLGPQMSDALCRISTGGAISERQLYTNADEVLIEVQRPVVCNGIEDLATRPDLIERGLHVELERITDRRDERAFWREFNNDLPHIFGALLKALSVALHCYDGVTIKNLPRMADFAKFAAAGIAELGFTTDEFLTAYRDNQDTGMSAGIESSPVGRAVQGFMAGRNDWNGTADALLRELGQVQGADVHSQAWPRTPRGLSGVLKRLSPALRVQGIEVSNERTAKARTIRLCNSPEQPSQPSFASRRTSGDDGNDANDGHSPQLHNASNADAEGEIL